jgi:hypothetical protein
MGELSLVSKIESECRQDLVAIDQPAEMIDCDAGVSITIIGDTCICLTPLNL